MTPAPLHLAGELLQLDPTGAVHWPAQRLLVVADLHLEKGSACARGGHLVPPYDTAATLARLSLLLRRYAPRVVVALGDSFHDRNAAARLSAADAALLAHLTAHAEFVWIAGNHDPAPPGFAGHNAQHFQAGPLVFRHQSAPGRMPPGTAELSGHFHPKARVVTRAAEIARPCFIADGMRIVLPAFGTYTGGLDVRQPAIAALFPRGGRVFLLGARRLFSFALTQTQSLQSGAPA